MAVREDLFRGCNAKATQREGERDRDRDRKSKEKGREGKVAV
jgi:hypothetical protein